MKLFSIIAILYFAGGSFLGAQEVTLKECIESSLKNKDNIIALRTNALVASLQTSAEYAGYLPRISGNYEYRFYPIIPSQVIPIGLFSPDPTDEQRAIKFGTPWQQNAGISFFQPLIDLTISSKIAESRINEKIKNSDVRVAELDLKTEVLKTYTNVWILEEQGSSALLDTLRAAKTLELLLDKSEEGQTERTDINRAQLNRNNALIAWEKVNSALFNEKIYLAFLTGLEPEYLLKGTFDYTFPSDALSSIEPAVDSLPEIMNLKLQEELMNRKIRSERQKYLPSIGIEGFVGANQYTNKFDPFAGQDWYGTSYVGVKLQLPLISGENKSSKITQFSLQAESIGSTISDKIKFTTSKNRQLVEETGQLKSELIILQQNVALLTENADLYREKFREGQLSAGDLLDHEIELSKEISKMNEIKARLAGKQIELISSSGNVNAFIRGLK